MTVDSPAKKWESLLVGWMSDLVLLKQKNQAIWESLELPDTEELRIRKSNSRRVDLVQATDVEVRNFLEFTDGWPLWLGPFKVKVLPAAQIGLFAKIYPEAYATALEHAPLTRIAERGSDAVSKGDLHNAIVLTGPDAREFILSLNSGHAVFYHFDGMMIFDDFFEYMKFRRGELLEEFIELLEMGKTKIE